MLEGLRGTIYDWYLYYTDHKQYLLKHKLNQLLDSFWQHVEDIDAEAVAAMDFPTLKQTFLTELAATDLLATDSKLADLVRSLKASDTESLANGLAILFSFKFIRSTPFSQVKKLALQDETLLRDIETFKENVAGIDSDKVHDVVGKVITLIDSLMDGKQFAIKPWFGHKQSFMALPVQLLTALFSFLDSKINLWRDNPQNRPLIDFVKSWEARFKQQVISRGEVPIFDIDGLAQEAEVETHLGRVYQTEEGGLQFVKADQQPLPVAMNVLTSALFRQLTALYAPYQLRYDRRTESCMVSTPYVEGLKPLTESLHIFNSSASVEEQRYINQQAELNTTYRLEFCAILALALYGNDRDVHGHNIQVKRDGHLYKIDHAWALESIAKCQPLHLFCYLSPLRAKNAIAPENHFRQYQGIIYHASFVEMLKQVSELALRDLSTSLADFSAQLDELLAITDEEARPSLLKQIMQHIGVKPKSRASDVEAACREIVQAVKLGLSHRAKSMHVLSLALSLSPHVIWAEPVDVCQVLLDLQKYLLINCSGVQVTTQHFIPIEAQTILKDALSALPPAKTKGLSALKDILGVSGASSQLFFSAKEQAQSTKQKTQFAQEAPVRLPSFNSQC